MAYLIYCVRFFSVLFQTFICFVVFYLLCAFWLPLVKIGPKANIQKGITLYVESNGVHTDFVLPAKSSSMNWFETFPAKDFARVDTTWKWVAIGWGDKGFYLYTKTWADLKWSTAFKAAFGLSTTALHVGYKQYRPKCDEFCTQLVISPEQYGLLIQYILSSLKWNNKQVQHILHPGYGEADTFYEANGSYSMFKTCNVWTCGGLHAIHQQCSMWSPFERGLMESLR
jgi:uncharacterized protein (TIGR02117 family)